jgi:hypothetical protein
LRRQQTGVEHVQIDDDRGVDETTLVSVISHAASDRPRSRRRHRRATLQGRAVVHP